jgi:hypothetical protein
MPAPFSGGCLCGAVRYQCTAEPFATLYCHCRDCQHAAGGPCSTIVMVAKAAVELTQGEVRSYTKQSDAGGDVTRQFCVDCGSPIFSVLGSNPDLLVIKAGSLDDASWLSPSMNIWTDSAQPWAHIAEDLPQMGKNPG